jgi:hypothetical protein
MLIISYYFLGVAVSILAALICLSTGKRAGKCVEVELDTLHAVSVCLPAGRRASADASTAAMYKDLTWDEKLKASDAKTVWVRWYDRCKRKAIEKQKVMFSWTRTLALCAALCLIGVLLETEFDQPITYRTILVGFGSPCPEALVVPISQLPPAHAASAADQPLREAGQALR